MKTVNKAKIVSYIIVAGISFYYFYVPTKFAEFGYDLAIDGIVTARGLCFVFTLYCCLKIIDEIFADV